VWLCGTESGVMHWTAFLAHYSDFFLFPLLVTVFLAMGSSSSGVLRSVSQRRRDESNTHVQFFAMHGRRHPPGVATICD
jgi:hypothetical protein